MDRATWLKGLFVSAVLLADATAMAASNDPLALRQQLVVAITRGDVNAAANLFAEDAVSDGPSTCGLIICIGKAAIRKDLENRIANQTRATTLNSYVSGNILTTRFQSTNKLTKKAGVDRIIFWAIYEVEDNKIKVERMMYERSDPQTARFLELLMLDESLQIPK